ncbi:uncharacterized protein LOC143021829 [Oratosquilla oratoria]|uniref:uncharacterized protein LOC143021829 n=1 Tax=Oratosquilla oratoria TaxID=337810 RepID=UPI003F76EED2
MELVVSDKLSEVFTLLKSAGGDAIYDDTVLEKLHTHIVSLSSKHTYGFAWASEIGLLEFLSAVLDASFIEKSSNVSITAMGLRAFAAYTKHETIFLALMESKILVNIVSILPSLRSDSTLAAATLFFTRSLLLHQSGRLWINENGFWEKFLLPCIRSQSYFVQREGAQVIAEILVYCKDSELFDSRVQDLGLISVKFCELKRHLNVAQGEELRQGNIFVFSVFRHLLVQTLGSVNIYGKLQKAIHLDDKLIYALKKQLPEDMSIQVSELLLLLAMHKFQEQLVEFGTVEQFLIDSICADILHLCCILLDTYKYSALIKGTAKFHVHWQKLEESVQSTWGISLSSTEVPLFLVLTFQLAPAVALYHTAVDEMCGKGHVTSWIQGIWEKIVIKKEYKEKHEIEFQKINKAVNQDPELAMSLCLSSIAALINGVQALHESCGISLFQGLLYLLKSYHIEDSPLRHSNKLQIAAIDGLRILVERYNIDWKKAFVSVCLLGLLCNLSTIPGLTTQAKVVTLRTMKSCVAGFIPPVMSMLVKSEHLESNSLEQMGELLSSFLVDTQWEVRDSALEVLLTCTMLAQCKYPYFIEWIVRHKLLGAVLAALNDIEEFIRASALKVTANMVSVERLCCQSDSCLIWPELEHLALQQSALVKVLQEEDVEVRKAALELVQALFNAGKYKEEEVAEYVVPIIQHLCEDSDSDIRQMAVSFIYSHQQELLLSMGMVDGVFPPNVFSEGKIIQLSPDKIRNRVMEVIERFCEMGHAFVLMQLTNDRVTAVVEETLKVLNCFADLVKQYNLSTWQRTEYSRKQEVKTLLTSKSEPDSDMSDVSATQVKQDCDETKEVEKALDDILTSTDLMAVNRIKYSGGKPLELKNIQIPKKLPAVDVKNFLQHLDSLHLKKEDVNPDAHIEEELISLLDDILRTPMKSESECINQQLRDCY